MNSKIKINNLNQKLFVVFMLLIPFLGFLVFTIYANFGGILLSFKKNNNGTEYFVGIYNYIRFITGFRLENYFNTVFISFGYFLSVVLISLPLSIIFAFFLSKKIPFSKIIIIILYLPNILPAAVLAEFYRRLWDSGGGIVSSGILNRMFSVFTGQTINWLVSTKYANFALYLYTIWFGFGFNAILIWGAMCRIPEELVESAQLDGSNLLKEFVYITIPSIWTTLTMVFILTLMIPSTVYMQPLLLVPDGRKDTTTLALLVIQQLKVNNDVYYSSAISITVAIVTLPIIFLTKSFLSKFYKTY